MLVWQLISQQILSMKTQVVFNKAGDKKVAVIVARLYAQGEWPVGLTCSLGEAGRL